jgi:hypothetical protein
MSKPISFSYSATRIGIVLSIVAIIGFMLSTVILGINPNRPKNDAYGVTEYPATLQSLASGCGSTFSYAPSESQYAVLPADTSDIATIPIPPMKVPVYGYMTQEPLARDQIRFYQKNEPALKNISREQILRTMFDNNTIVFWYSKDIAPDDYSSMKSYVTQTPNTMAVEWSAKYGQGNLPLDRTIGVSTWAYSQSCEFWNESTVKEFRNFVIENKYARPKEVREAKDTEGRLPQLTLPTRS